MLFPQRRFVPLLLCAALTAAVPATAVESGPQGVVRQFCQADALGLRVSGWGWADLARLVSWPLEPAWDEGVLITGYEVGPPRLAEDGSLAVDVSYTVVGHVSALGFDPTAYIETVTFRVHAPGEAGWRIIGPPPVPHLFGSRVDVDAMRRSLAQGTPSFVSNTLFVWLMYQGAGWDVAYERTVDLLGGDAYRSVEEPRVGDLAVYTRDDRPYHVGIVEGEGQIVSSTLNAGVVRAPVDAFAGDVHYLRLVAPEQTSGGLAPHAAAPLFATSAGSPPSRAAHSPPGDPAVPETTEKHSSRRRGAPSSQHQQASPRAHQGASHLAAPRAQHSAQ